MTGRSWVLRTIATIVIAVAATAAIGYGIDPYGVWRDPTGRKLAIYFSERRAKFLMNKRYVPANFDGLIVGPSSTESWDFSTLAGATIYNESLAGANAAEEQVLVNEVLGHGHIKLAIFILAPIMTSSHDLKDGMDKVKTSEAMVSIHVLVHEAAHSLTAMHVPFDKSDTAPNGMVLFRIRKKREIDVPTLPPTYFEIDPIALKQYCGMVQSLRDRGARIVYLVSPLYEPFYQANQTSFTAYLEAVRSALPPAPVIDFDSPEYLSLRRDPQNFFDCFHLAPEGAAIFTALLGKLVPDAIASRD